MPSTDQLTANRESIRGERFSFPPDVDLDDADSQRFAIGTREIDKLSLAEVVESEPLELGLLPHAAFVIGTSGRIEDVNTLAENLIGYTRAQLVGELMDRMVSDLDCVRATQLGEVGVRVMPAASGVCVYHQNGRALPASVVLCPHVDGSLLALVTPIAGVADRGLGATDVVQIVHDLKNPLSTIALEMCVLDEKLAVEGRADLRATVGRVIHNVEFLDRMVQELLDSCAIDAGQFAVERAPTELRSLLAQIIDRVVATRDRGRVFLEAPVTMTLSIDDLRIERVLANLLQNALKYAPRDTGIVVRLDSTADFARVSVIDAGPGMTPAESSYVFDKYRRTASARGHEGSGLGLYISKQIIDAHGGRIGVDSVQGIGSRFFIELPLR